MRSGNVQLDKTYSLHLIECIPGKSPVFFYSVQLLFGLLTVTDLEKHKSNQKTMMVITTTAATLHPAMLSRPPPNSNWGGGEGGLHASGELDQKKGKTVLPRETLVLRIAYRHGITPSLLRSVTQHVT